MSINFPTSPADGDAHEGYVWVAAENAWRKRSPQLGDLSDIDASGVVDGEVLSFDGTNWVNQELQIASTIEDLTDTTISSPSEGDIMVYNGSSWINTPATSGNAIINGDFGVWQRGTTFSGGYTADRLFFNTSGGVGTVTRQDFTPGDIEAVGYGDAQYYARCAMTVANDNAGFQYRVEDVRTFANQEVTLSAWVRSSDATSFQFNIQHDFGDGGSPTTSIATQSFTPTSSWVRYSATFTLPSVLGKSVGTNSHLTININNSNTETFTLDLWGVQLEAGSVATPFRLAGGGSKGAELALCQRYYYYYSWASGNQVRVVSGYGNGTGMLQLSFPVKMRVGPSGSNDAGAGVQYYGTSGWTDTTLTQGAYNEDAFWFGATVDSSGNVRLLKNNTGADVQIKFDAEL